MALWHIGVAGWVLQDGGIDFSRGQRAEFAVEFAASELREADDRRATARSVDGDDAYEIRGPVVFRNEETLVLDCGILVYAYVGRGARSAPESDAVAAYGYLLMESPGEWPWSEPEQLPPLSYAWRIEQIRRETSPYIELAPKTFTRDLTRRSYEVVEATDALGRDSELDPRGPDYVLDCVVLDEPPRPLLPEA